MYLKLIYFSFISINFLFHIFQCSNIPGVVILDILIFVFKYDWSRCAQFSFFSRHLIFSYNSSTTAEKSHFLIDHGTVNWRYIFQCDCCKLENDDDIPRTLPDLSIIYKLHLESRKLINMYDWLQVTIRPVLMFTG